MLAELLESHTWRVGILALVITDGLITSLELLADTRALSISSRTANMPAGTSLFIASFFVAELGSRWCALGTRLYRFDDKAGRKMAVWHWIDGVVIVGTFLIDLLEPKTSLLRLIVLIRLWKVIQIASPVAVFIEEEEESLAARDKEEKRRRQEPEERGEQRRDAETVVVRQ